MRQLGLSARSCHRVLMFSRTIAYLAEAEENGVVHPSATLRAGLAEALQYRPREQAG